MMDTLQQGILTLMHSAVSGEAKSLPEGFDLDAAMPLIRMHKIANLVYYGAVKCGIDSQLPAMRELFAATCKCIMVDEQQQAELDKLVVAFQEEGIYYLPLKGVMLKGLYPKTDMRIMGDADIMIRTEQYDKICSVVERLGYVYKVETDHELVWDNQKLHLELHKRLVPSYNENFAAYYEDCWRLGRPIAENSCQHEMSDEDHLIFLLVHFAKHYRNGGIGVRHVLDLYIYKKAKPDMDEQYILVELEKLNLSAFYTNIFNTISVWFEGGEETEETRLIAEHIFQSGAYGTKDGRTKAEAIRDKAKNGLSSGQLKRKRWLHAIFLPYSSMCVKYPVLKKMPVLLPVMWVVRWFGVLFKNPDRIRYQRHRIGLTQEETLLTYEDRMASVGLSFHFEETEQ